VVLLLTGAAWAEGGSGCVTLGDEQLLVDLRAVAWEYVVPQPVAATAAGFGRSEKWLKLDSEQAPLEYAAAMATQGWQTIRVGQRWENMGHAELNDQVTWLRLRFRVPASVRGYRLGFFCTAVDDAADFFLNGTHLGRRFYRWGARVPEPVDVDLTGQIRFGEENVLVVRVTDYAQARGGGVLGHVFLYRTLPYTRTVKNGIAVKGEGKDRGVLSPRPFDGRGAGGEGASRQTPRTSPSSVSRSPHPGPLPEGEGGLTQDLSVVLHLGDALLARGGTTTFTAAELRDLDLPPYILRDDELVLVAPAAVAAKRAGTHRVELDEVLPTHDDRALAVKCDRLPAKVERFERLTIPIHLSATYENAFDPREINVQAEVETPSGKTEQVPAFFFQDFKSVALTEDQEILLPKRCDPWRLYYRPQQVGRYKLHVIVGDRSGMARTPDQTFEVVASQRKGFLRVSKIDPRYFEFDNGESYFGIGPSGWMRESNYIFGGNPRWVSTRRLDDYYGRKARAGCNYDYCLAEFFGRLYTRGGYIDQHVAWKCEHRVRTMEEQGIYWVTCYDDLCRSICYGLDTLPYSEAQGGPCRTIEELYFHPRAIQMQRDHLRYFVGRMADSPALMVWAIGDEGQAGARFSPLMTRSWIKGLQNYVREIDVYQHPHIMCEGPRSLAEGGDAIIIPDWYFHRDVDAVTLSLELMQKYGQFNCPLINPEGGMVEWTKPEDALGPKRALYYLSGERWKFPEAISFHNHLWISLFLKNAVGGTEWMGAFIDRKNELYHATAMRNYLAGESLTKPHWEMATASVSNEDLRGFCLTSEGKSLAWVQNRFYTWLEAGHQGKTPPTIAGAEVSIPVKKDGAYRVELWDTRSGKVVSSSNATATSQTVRYALPPIVKDVALKAILQ
jgi:hypothetical protein